MNTFQTAQNASAFKTTPKTGLLKKRSGALKARASKVLNKYYNIDTGHVETTLESLKGAMGLKQVVCNIIPFHVEQGAHFLFIFSDRSALVASSSCPIIIHDNMPFGKNAEDTPVRFSPVVFSLTKGAENPIQYVAHNTPRTEKSAPLLDDAQQSKAEIRAHLAIEVARAVEDARVIGPITPPWKASEKTVTAPWITGSGGFKTHRPYLQELINAGCAGLSTDDAISRWQVTGAVMSEDGRVNVDSIAIFYRRQPHFPFIQHNAFSRWLRQMLTSPGSPFPLVSLISHTNMMTKGHTVPEIVAGDLGFFNNEKARQSAHERLTDAARFHKINDTWIAQGQIA